MKSFKSFMVLMILVVIAGVCLAQMQIIPFNMDEWRVNPGQVHTGKVRWTVINTTSSTSTEPSDLDDTERTYQNVVTAIAAAASGDEKITIFDVPQGWNAARFRCRGVTEGGNIIHYLYFGTLGDGNKHVNSTSADCELILAATLDWTLGDQESIDSTYDEMADTLTLTAGAWNKSWGSTSPTSDFVAEAVVDLIGVDLIVIVTQTSGCDSQLLAKGF